MAFLLLGVNRRQTDGPVAKFCVYQELHGNVSTVSGFAERVRPVSPSSDTASNLFDSRHNGPVNDHVCTSVETLQFGN